LKRKIITESGRKRKKSCAGEADIKNAIMNKIKRVGKKVSSPLLTKETSEGAEFECIYV